MTKRYRQLTVAELEGVRLEFVQFLASEGIAADDWERKLAQNSPDVQACIDEFSEKFWDGATGAIKCLEHRPDDQNLWLFHFGETSAHHVLMNSVRSSGTVQPERLNAWSTGPMIRTCGCFTLVKLRLT